MTGAAGANESALARAHRVIEELRRRLQRAEAREPIAVVGIGCRFPGGADGPQRFWQLLTEGREAICDVPVTRWDKDAWFDEDRAAPGRMNMRRAGFLTGDINAFDAPFFGIAPREAASMDPQHRLALEVAWEALEHAAIAPDALNGTDTGVFLGLYHNNYTQTGRGSQGPQIIDGWAASGGHTSVAPGRISYCLGLRGPSVAVDTACSSSLVAVDLAIKSLLDGDCRLALAGGVHLLLGPEALVASTKLGATSADGRCKTFDAAADGFGHGEGCGIVVLKRLSDALRDRDRIEAVILGTAVNQDGRSNSLTAPNGPAQEAVVAKALARARIAPSDVFYVEAHGTGTPLGDPIELEALANVLGKDRDGALTVGSVKTNIGHLEAAAGIAGLIKAILAVREGLVPAHRNFSRMNPHVDTGGVPIAVPVDAAAFPGGARRIAGVSAFGFAGTNAHAIVAEPPVAVDAPAEGPATVVIPVSAKSAAAARTLAAQWADALEEGAPLRAAAHTAGAGRAHHAVRLAVPAADGASAARMLRAAEPVEGTRPSRIAFLFTGQGAQYPGMARGAYHAFPAFRDALDNAAAALEASPAWSGRPGVLSTLFGTAPLDDTALAQPLTVAVELALAALWRSFGIQPVALLGHSVGEYAAAAVAGAYGEAEVLALVAARGRAMAALPEGGGMLAVLAGEDVARAHGEGLDVAAVNGPANTVLSGSREDLARAMDVFAERGILTRPLSVSHAFHSAQMDPALDTLEHTADALGARTPRLPVYSNLDGAPVDRFDGAYWRRHTRAPVRFADGLAALANRGVDMVLEIGPQAILSPLAARALGVPAVASLIKDRADDAAIAEALAALYTGGAPIDWQAVAGPSPPRPIRGPTMAFERTRHWLDLPPVSAPEAADARERPPAPAGEDADGADLIYDFYDELTVVSRTEEARDDTTEGHLTFGFLDAPDPSFSWVRALFDHKEDPAAHDLLRRTQRRLKDSLFAGVDFGAMLRVHDYGCGHAADLCALATAHPHLTLSGYTLSAEQVAVGRARAQRLGVAHNVTLRRANSSRVPFPDGCDLIFGFEVTGLVADKAALFDNIADHLSPGGLLVIADFVSTGEAIANPETNSFTPSIAEWTDLLSRRKLRLTRVTEASVEVANWLDDPHFEANVDQVVDRFGLSALTRRHLLSNGNIGRALRAGLMRYLLLTAQASPHESEAAIARANAALLRSPVPWRETEEANAAPWAHWTYDVAWVERPARQALPAPGALGRALAADVAREAAALVPYGEAGRTADALSLGYTLAAFRALGCASLADARTVPVAPRHERLRGRLVAVMAAAGHDTLPNPGDVDAAMARALARHPEAAAEFALLSRCGPHLAAVLTGKADPLELLFPGGDASLAEALYSHSPFSAAVQRIVGAALKRLGRPVDVIELGAGTGATTAAALAALGDTGTYTATDLGASLVARAAERFAGPGRSFRILDAGAPPDAQGIAPHAFDVVVAANVIHATPDLARTLQNARRLLAPEGLLVLVENTGRLAWGDLTFGLTEGMWSFTDTHLRDYALLTEDGWRDLLPQCGFDDVTVLTPGEADAGGLSQQCVILARAVPGTRAVVGDPDRAAALLARSGNAAADEVEEADEVVWIAPHGKPADLVDEALALARQMAARPRAARLTLVTEGALPAQGACTLAHAPLAGLSRTIAAELPELAARLVDLDPARPDPEQSLDALLCDMRGEIAIRGGRRLAPQLVPLPLAPAAPKFEASDVGIVTGAFGGVGLALTAWLAQHGLTRLVLMGRNAPTGAAEARLDALRKAGATPQIVNGDVSVRADVERLLAQSDGLGERAHVFHAAGALSDAAISQMTRADIDAVFAAKVDGSLHLDSLTRHRAVANFVLFSSAAALLGPAGQANHAAASSLLRSLAVERHRHGLPALAVEWGNWADVGAVVKAGLEGEVAASGLLAMPPRAALDALGAAMAADRPAIAILNADWDLYRTRYPHGMAGVMVPAREREAPAGPAPVRSVAPEAPDTAQGWAALLERTPAAGRLDALRDAIRTEAAGIMGLAEASAISDSRPLRDLGLDSLMSVEMRNVLAARTGARLPATLLFDHPTVAALADTLAAGPLAAHIAATLQGGDLDSLGVDDLSALLEAELQAGAAP